MPHSKPRPPLSAILRTMADDTSRDRLSIADLLVALGDRAIGALLFVFAFPNVLPAPPGLSGVLGAPLIFLAAQLTIGSKPWLPELITQRSMARQDFQALFQRMAPWLERAEKLLRPRVTVMTLPPMEYLIGLVCLLMACVLILPIPLGNILPALAISLMGLGIMTRDGIWTLLGLVVAVGASVIVSGVVFAMGKAALYLMSELLH
ncbi:MAG TPA: exopolysaccharide biosynthesis protein [Dongiaceae bacterium]|nr:exopolysaccharide biosynthesis protein [Dongiaceae bacterium]